MQTRTRSRKKNRSDARMATNMINEKLVSAFYQQNIMKEIQRIVNECEAIQHSNESECTKERARLSAYYEISELVKEDRDGNRK